jgi:hypothetical protein
MENQENKGIDYGLGNTNIDKNTGIRYGVIPQNEVLQAWADSSEGYYGNPICPKCFNEADKTSDYGNNDPMVDDDGNDIIDDYYCSVCNCGVDDNNPDNWRNEALSYFIDDKEYSAECSDGIDIFITKSPYYTRARFCSPCAPGACYLTNPCENGEKAYCFGHDWFENEKAPYPVYRVSDDTIVNSD